MAETPPPQPAPISSSSPDPVQYWCYHCDKRVSIETLTDLPDIICFECKNGFVESISAVLPVEAQPSQGGHEPSFSHQFLQVLRLIAESARDSDVPPPPPPPDRVEPSDPDDFLRLELDGWNNDEDDEDDDDDEAEVEVEEEEEEEGEEEIDFANGDRSDDNDNETVDEDEDGEDRRRRRREILRLRIRDFATRAASGRNRIVEWSEILMGLENTAMELRVEMAESDGYIGNPEDYVDAAGYEVLLQNFAESEGGTRRGAPPASKLAVLCLKNVEIQSEDEILMCAICKEVVQIGEVAKKLPCDHGYHGVCIDPWLGARNSCPVCRFELPTDDQEYEDERKKKRNAGGPSNSALPH